MQWYQVHPFCSKLKIIYFGEKTWLTKPHFSLIASSRAEVLPFQFDDVERKVTHRIKAAEYCSRLPIIRPLILGPDQYQNAGGSFSKWGQG